MSRTEIILGFIETLRSTEDLDSVKFVLLAVSRKKPKLHEFVKLALEIVEKERPLLIEMKEVLS